MSGQAPLSAVDEQQVPAVSAVQASTDNLVEAPFAGVVSEVIIEPAAAIVGQAINFATVQVVNKGQDGTGVTVVASLPFNAAGVTAARDAARVVPLSVVAGATTVADDDVLDVQVVQTGTGLALPSFKARVTFSRA